MGGSNPSPLSRPVSPNSSDVYLLDSSVLIPSLRGDVAMKQRIDVAAQLYVSSIVLEELYFGAYGSPTRSTDALAEVAHIARTITVLAADETTADIYGRIKQEQKVAGHTMPDNDLWIAATAIHYGVTLAARDAHFTWISGLKSEQW